MDNYGTLILVGFALLCLGPPLAAALVVGACMMSSLINRGQE